MQNQNLEQHIPPPLDREADTPHPPHQNLQLIHHVSGWKNNVVLSSRSQTPTITTHDVGTALRNTQTRARRNRRMVAHINLIRPRQRRPPLSTTRGTDHNHLLLPPGSNRQRKTTSEKTHRQRRRIIHHKDLA